MMYQTVNQNSPTFANGSFGPTQYLSNSRPININPTNINASLPQYVNTSQIRGSLVNPPIVGQLPTSPLPQYQPINTRIIQANGPQQMIYPPQYGYYQPNVVAPSYIVQPMPIMRRHPQSDLNMNFDYETANFLCEAKITQNSIYCVVCQTNYKASEKNEHIKKHIRKPTQMKQPDRAAVDKLKGFSQNKPTYIVKPIVEPEQYNVQFDPAVYTLTKEIIYEDLPRSSIEIQTDNGANTNYKNNVNLNNVLNVPSNLDPLPQFFVPSNSNSLNAPIVADNSSSRVSTQKYGGQQVMFRDTVNKPANEFLPEQGSFKSKPSEKDSFGDGTLIKDSGQISKKNSIHLNQIFKEMGVAEESSPADANFKKVRQSHREEF